jgi:hypothetical protein
MKSMSIRTLLLLVLSATPSALHAFNFGFETSEGFAAGPLHGQPSSASTTFAADPAVNSSNATNSRFSIVSTGGVNNSQALQLGSMVTKNFEAVLIPLQPADYGATSGLPTKLFRIGASVKRSSALGARFDPDFTFEWGSVADFRMVKMRVSPYGELLVYEKNRIVPNYIPGVFAGGSSSPFRRIEAVVNYPNRTYKLYIDGVPQLGGRDIGFATADKPAGQIQVGFSACVLGPIYVVDDFSCKVEPGAADITPPVLNQPDDAVSLPAGTTLPLNVYASTWKPSEQDRRNMLGGLDVNWYISYRTAYPNLPKFKKADGNEVLRMAEEIIASSQTLPPHPRLFFPDLPVVAGKTPLQVLQDRAADPSFAVVTDQIKRQGQAALDAAFPPTLQTGQIDAEDPGRGMSDVLDWLGLAYLIETDTGKKAALQTRLKDWIKWHLDTGNFTAELPLGQSISSLSRMYDWFYYDFLAQDPPFRKRLKHGIAQRVRFRSDMANRTGSGRNPISAPIYNHAWFSNLGPGMAGLALWGDHDADLPAAEIQGWLAEGFDCFSMQQGMMPSDGGTIEGWSYEAYGGHAVYDFVTNAEKVLGLGGQLIDSEHNRNRCKRVFFFSPMLKQDQLMRFGDGFIQGAGGGSVYHYLANRYRNPAAQLLGNTMMAQPITYWPLYNNWGTGNDYWPNHWRSMFWYDPALKPSAFTDLPLFKNGGKTIHGLCSARSSWAPDGSASAISFRCGINAGLDQLRIWNGNTAFDDHECIATANLVFFDGTNEILPTTEWLGVKWSGYFNTALFTPRDGQLAVNNSSTTNTLIGQVNALQTGVPLTFTPPYTDNYRAPRIIHAINNADVHSYLMEFGATYILTEFRNTGTANGATKANRQTTFPTYFRRIVYLPQRNVAIVADQIRTFYGRQPVYHVATRFLNPVLTTTSPGNGTMDFTQLTSTPAYNGNQSTVDYDGRLVFFSPSAGTAALDATPVATARDSARENLRYTISGDVTESAFGFAVGKKANLAGLSFAITGGNLVISGLPGGDQSYPINDDNPLPVQAAETRIPLQVTTH